MINFRILGPLDAVDEGRALQLGRPRQRGLLAILLLQANEVVSTDRLIDQLWRGEPPTNAANTLQATISRLRKALEDVSPGSSRLLATRTPGYLLELLPEQLDLSRFMQFVGQGREALAAGDAESASTTLRTALALWRGPLLADLTYEPFVQAEAPRLEEARLEAVELRVEADLARGQHAVLVGELEALVAEHPYRERLRSQLMLALYRSERQAEALQAYQDARRLLADELGIEPSRALQRLERAILVQDPSLELAPARARATAADGGSTVAVIERERTDSPVLRAAEPPRPEDRISHRDRARRARLLVAGGAVLAAGAGLVAGVLLAFSGGGTQPLRANALGLLDAESGRVLRSLDTGSGSGAVAIGGGSVWVVQPGSGTVLRVEPQRAAVVDVVHVGPTPAAATVAAGSVWVANGGNGTLSRISLEPG